MRVARDRWKVVVLIILLLVVAASVIGFVGARIWDRLSGNYPIAFYGRVVDADGHPIAGVAVDFQTCYSDQFAFPIAYGRTERVRKQTVTSDVNGDFELRGTSGYGVAITNFHLNGKSLNWAFPPRDPRVPKTVYTYDEKSVRATIPDTPTRRATFPLARAKPGTAQSRGTGEFTGEFTGEINRANKWGHPREINGGK